MLPPNVGLSDLDAEAVDFLHGLFAPYAATGERDLTVELRAFRPKWAGGNLTPNLFFSCDTVGWFEAVWRAQKLCRGYDVYMGVLPRVGVGSGTGNDLRWCGWIYAELDPGEQSVDDVRELLARVLASGAIPPPQIVVKSGGGLHVYWRLDRLYPMQTPDDRERFKNIIRRLGKLFGNENNKIAHACKDTIDPTRILRLPGTYNLKYWFKPDETNLTKPTRVRLVLCETNKADCMPLVWWECHLPALQKKTYHGPANVSGSRPAGELYPGTIARLTQPAGEGGKHYACRAAGCGVRHAGGDFGAVVNAIEQVKTVSGVPTDTYDEKHRTERLAAWIMDNVQPDI